MLTRSTCSAKLQIVGKQEKGTAMKRYSENELWAFINRIDSHEKVEIAADFITKQEYLDIDTYNDMMDAIAFISRDLYRTR